MTGYKAKRAPGARVLVGLSGRLERADSFLVAALLRNQGHEVLGVHLRTAPTGDWAGFKSHCSVQPDIELVQEACRKLDIPLQIVEAHDQFINEVVDYAIHETLLMRKPRACVPCNDRVRLPILFKKAEELRCEMIATGHHAQVSKDLSGGPARLLRSVNPGLDQSQDLFRLGQKELERLFLPLGSLSPGMLSKLGQELGLPLRDVSKMSGADSECFLDDPKYFDFVESKTAPSLRSRGIIRGSEGGIMGEHHGLFRYQLGSGEGLSALQAAGDARVVVDYEPGSQALVLGKIEDVTTEDVLLVQVSWIRPIDGLRSKRCTMLTRSMGKPLECEIVTFESARAQIKFPKKYSGFIPGQPAVFYEGDEVLGGGFIDRIKKVW